MKVPEYPKVERISFRYISDQLLKVFNLEKGMGYTIKWLLINPKKAVQEYLYEDRHRMVKPFPFLIFVTAVATFLTLTLIFKGDELLTQLHADSNWNSIPEQWKTVLDQLVIVTQKYFNLSYLSSIPFVSLATFWVFKEDGLNLAEHLVINIYLFCMQTVILVIMIPFLGKWPELGLLSSCFITVYIVYAYCQIFELKWWQGLAKTLVVYIIYGLISVVLLIFFALIILGLA